MSTESGYQSSDLSNQKFEYDLVVGTTAEAINATLKMYLCKNAPAPKEIWYGQAEAGGEITQMAPISGVDPFAIPTDGTVPQALLDSDFVFAIKAGFGLPAGVSPLDIPDILILGTDSQKVNYNMFFNTFQICTLDWGRHGSFAWNNYQQPAGSPYIFNYQVDMNFDPADPNDPFSGLPPAVQQELKNYNTNTMFSVQQLYLDLNNAGLQSMPKIEGVPSTSKVYVVLQSDFIDTYWADIAQSGQFILGYAVHTNSQPTARTSLQPTSLNFMTVPHYDANGNITNDTSLYTLNYLMDTNNRKLTVGGPFTWNWVKSDEVNSYHGAMAVRREVFANYLMNAIAPYLRAIAITPWTKITMHNAGLSCTSSYSLSQTPNQQFTYEAAGGPKVASYSFTKEAKSSDTGGLITGHFNLTSTASASISISGTELTVVTAANMEVDFSNGDIGGAGDVKGRVGGYSNTAIFEVAVDAGGKITVSDKPGYPKPEIKKPDLSQGFLAGLDGSAQIADSLKGNYGQMTTAMQGLPALVETYLNSTGGRWVFPGGQTFLFKDAMFSDYQDFITHITYADPTF